MGGIGSCDREVLVGSEPVRGHVLKPRQHPLVPGGRIVIGVRGIPQPARRLQADDRVLGLNDVCRKQQSIPNVDSIREFLDKRRNAKLAFREGEGGVLDNLPTLGQEFECDRVTAFELEGLWIALCVRGRDRQGLLREERKILGDRVAPPGGEDLVRSRVAAKDSGQPNCPPDPPSAPVVEVTLLDKAGPHQGEAPGPARGRCRSESAAGQDRAHATSGSSACRRARAPAWRTRPRRWPPSASRRASQDRLAHPRT